MKEQVIVEPTNIKDALPDMDFFKKYPAPMFEAMYGQHISSINTTSNYYGPLIYFIMKANTSHNVLEIGMAQGWTSYFMACAVHENNQRFGAGGYYYGCDITDKTYIFDDMKAKGLTNIKNLNKDSLKITKDDWVDPGITLDLIFQDGWHSTSYILDEWELLMPFLKDNGNGYFIMHDVYAWGEEGYKLIKKKYPFMEHVAFMNNYGLAIFRNMKNFDYDKVHWPEGGQKPEYPKAEEITS